MKELKPCPFCGGEAYPVGTTLGVMFICKQCKCWVTFPWKEDAKHQKELWNRRYNES